MELGNQSKASGKIFALVGTFQSIGFSLGPIMIGATYRLNIKYSFFIISAILGVILLLNVLLCYLHSKENKVSIDKMEGII